MVIFFNFSHVIGNVNQNGICKSSCDANFGFDPADVNKICKLCKDYGYYNYLNSCVLSCPSEFIGDTNNNCVQCVYQGAICQPKCNSGFTLVSGSKNCVSCTSIGKFDFNGECVDICPTFYTNFAGTCLLDCPNGYKANGSTCEKCSFFNEYDENGICVATCSSGYYLKSNKCVTCKYITYFRPRK